MRFARRAAHALHRHLVGREFRRVDDLVVCSALHALRPRGRRGTTLSRSGCSNRRSRWHDRALLRFDGRGDRRVQGVQRIDNLTRCAYGFGENPNGVDRVTRFAVGEGVIVRISVAGVEKELHAIAHRRPGAPAKEVHGIGAHNLEQLLPVSGR